MKNFANWRGLSAGPLKGYHILLSFILKMSCGPIRIYRSHQLPQVGTTINGAYRTHIYLDPKTCLLGYLNEELFPKETLKPVDRLLFITRKLITIKWLSPSLPLIKKWRFQINDTILMEQQVYCNRGTPDELDKLVIRPRTGPISFGP